MKRSKFPLTLAMIIAIEMIVSPVVAHAQQATGLLGAVQIFGAVINQNQQMGPSPQTIAQVGLLRQQANPVPDEFFRPERMAQIPGLYAYLDGKGIPRSQVSCLTLRPRPDRVVAEVCTQGFTPQPGMSLQPQVLEADAFQKGYAFIANEYQNFQVDSPTGAQQNQGLTCMRRAMQHLNGFFQLRVNELDALVAKLESMGSQLKKASQADLNAIEEFTAILEGQGAGDLLDKVRTRRPDVSEFGKRFADPACSAMFTPDRFNTEGTERGLNGINQLLKQSYEAPGGRFSGQSYPQASAQIETDLRSLASKVAEQTRLNFTNLADSNNGQGISRFLQGLPSSISSTTGVNEALTLDVFADVQSRFNDQNTRLRTRTVELVNELAAAGVDPEAAVRGLTNRNNTTFSSDVTALENEIKNSCLTRQVSAAGLENVLGRFRDRSLRGRRTGRGPNLLAQQIPGIMNNTGTTIEQKLEQIRQLEEQTKNRYTLELDTDMIVQRRQADGSVSTERERPTSFSDYVRQLNTTCTQQFRTNQLKSMTAQNVIEGMRGLRREYESFAQTTATELQNEIINKMINCPGNTVGNTTGSCTPDTFNNARGGFCARTANVCAGKMRACTENTQNLVTAMKGERKRHTDSYKNIVDAKKAQIVALFDATYNRYMAEAGALSGQFGVGFVPPTGIVREVPEGERFLPAFANIQGDRLQLEDPDKLIEMFRQNVVNLKEKVVEQQNQIMGGGGGRGGGGGGLLAQHIERTKAAYRTAQTETQQMAEDCQSKITELRRFEQEQQRRMAEENEKRNRELGEKRNAVCSRVRLAQIDPRAGCQGNLQDAASFDPNIAGQLAQFCRESGNNNDDGREERSEQRRIAELCTSRTPRETSGTTPEPVTRTTGNPPVAATQASAQNRDVRNMTINELCDVWFNLDDSTVENRRPGSTGDTSAERSAEDRVTTTRSGRRGTIEALILARDRRDREQEEDYENAAPEAPAYCAAGFNGDRSVPEQMGAAFQGVAQGIGGSRR